jgi:Tfp pilus assembly protein PilF
MNPRIESLKKMLDGPRDGALLRFSLGNEYLKAGALADAEKCFRAAVDHDKHYSAAWKALGKTLADNGQPAAALAAYEMGIEVAKARGDIQAAKEMAVFARRLSKTATQ